MKQLLFILMMLLCVETYAHDKGTLYIKGGEKRIVKDLKKHELESSFYYIDSLNKLIKTSVPNWLIDSFVLGKMDTSKIVNPVVALPPAPTVVVAAQPEAPAPIIAEPTKTNREKYYSFNYAIGLTLGNFLELNNPNSEDKKGFSFAGSLDMNYRYNKPNAFINMSHELHYNFGVQKESLEQGANIQKVQDELVTLHDISVKIKRNSKWNINTIINFSTAIFTTFDGEYFEDVNNLGHIKGFMSPYTLGIAPGVKYDVSNALKISLSPYSFEYYGVRNEEISKKGIFITETDDNGNFKKSIIRKQGMELNIWLDKNLGEWLEMQYRVAINSNYDGNMGENTILDGLFLTKIKVIKNVYLTHRATINSNFAGNLLKPFFTQTIQLSINKSI